MAARADPGKSPPISAPHEAGTVTVAGKLGLDVPPGTLNSILKQSGLKRS
jgi:predicted RNA binding protein YcfA (HicA-like mRNA interferase family)